MQQSDKKQSNLLDDPLYRAAVMSTYGSNQGHRESVVEGEHADGRQVGWDMEGDWYEMGEQLLLAAPSPSLDVAGYLTGDAYEPRSRGPQEIGLKARIGVHRGVVLWAALIAFVAGAVAGYVFREIGAEPRVRYQVRFVYADPDARSVSVVGDFNDWKADQGRMTYQPATGMWEAWLEVKPGRHRYLFLLDEHHRIVDPGAAERVMDSSGSMVSVIHVPTFYSNSKQ